VIDSDLHLTFCTTIREGVRREVKIVLGRDLASVSRNARSEPPAASCKFASVTGKPAVSSAGPNEPASPGGSASNRVLCQFLDVPKPNTPFPRRNTASDITPTTSLPDLCPDIGALRSSIHSLTHRIAMLGSA
jgi:hypothetical protein